MLKAIRLYILSRTVWVLVLPIRIIVWPYLWWFVRKWRKKNLRYYPSCALDKWLIHKGHVVSTWGYLPWEERPKNG